MPIDCKLHTYGSSFTENKDKRGLAPIIYSSGCIVNCLDKLSVKASHSDLQRSSLHL